MKFLLLAFLYGASLAAADCGHDNCLRALIASAFPTRNGAGDCSSFLLQTLIPATVTNVETITDVAGTATQTSTSVVMKTTTKLMAIAGRQVIVAPSAIPPYASACSGAVRYSSACSCIGVSQRTTTLPAPTALASTTTSTTTTTTIGTTTTATAVSVQDIIFFPIQCTVDIFNLNPSGETYSELTLEYAALQCADYSYFVVHGGTSYFCSNFFPPSLPDPDNSCVAPCGGNSDEYCGGNVFSGTVTANDGDQFTGSFNIWEVYLIDT